MCILVSASVAIGGPIRFNFTFDGIKAGHKARHRIQEYIYKLFEDSTSSSNDVDIEELKNNIFTELSNDLHTPKALAHIFSFIKTHPAAVQLLASAGRSHQTGLDS